MQSLLNSAASELISPELKALSYPLKQKKGLPYININSWKLQQCITHRIRLNMYLIVLYSCRYISLVNGTETPEVVTDHIAVSEKSQAIWKVVTITDDGAICKHN